jgi:UDP-2,4-diacetamido-2,4,6-trideoxy-beta-L-altropyranose hydrolase
MTSPEGSTPGIAFRTTAGKGIGFGHLRRCITLATAVRAAAPSVEVEFWIDGPPDAAAFCARHGFVVQSVNQGDTPTMELLRRSSAIGILIVDAYDVDAASLTTWKSHVDALVVVDDLADRFLDADLVINGSPYARGLSYRVAGKCLMLLGPDYALLRSSFQGWPARQASEQVSRVLVTLGGADPDGLTEPVVLAVRRALPVTSIDVIVGPLFGPTPGLDALAASDASLTHLHRGIDDPTPLMAQAEMAVSGGGQTLYELAATGLPAVAMCLASNQEGNVSALATVPTLLRAPVPASAASSDWSSVADTVRALAADRQLRQRMSEVGRKLIDGRGAPRVAAKILALGPRQPTGFSIEN